MSIAWHVRLKQYRSCDDASDRTAIRDSDRHQNFCRMQGEKASVCQDLSVKLESIDHMQSVPCDNSGSIGCKTPTKIPGRDSTHKTHRSLCKAVRDEDRLSRKDTNALRVTDVRKDLFQTKVSDGHLNICEPSRHSSKQYAQKKCTPRSSSSSSSTKCAHATENTETKRSQLKTHRIEKKLNKLQAANNKNSSLESLEMSKEPKGCSKSSAGNCEKSSEGSLS